MTGLLNSAIASAASAINSSWGSPGSNQYKLTFQISPIVLTNGIAAGAPGGAMPIMSITEAQHYTGLTAAFSAASPLAGLTNLAGAVINNVIGDLLGGGAADTDNYFAHYRPLPGASLVSQEIGEYPFANQTVAANAVIATPNVISLLMICPVRDPGGYPQKFAIMMALQAALKQHNSTGGTYTIATPSFMYTDCVMRSMRDVTPGNSKQVQIQWQLDFEQPLLTLEQAQQQQSALMSKISGGTQTTGDPPPWSGNAPNVGFPPGLAGPAVIPALAGLAAGVAAGLPSLPGIGLSAATALGLPGVSLVSGIGLDVGLDGVTLSADVGATVGPFSAGFGGQISV